MLLDSYGYNSHWHDLYQAIDSPGEPGRVTVVDRGACGVATAHGIVRARSGRHDVCTGDWVLVDSDTISAVLPRRTAIVRASAGTTSTPQTLASNVDTVVVTVAADTDLDLGRVERYVALAWDSGAAPVVVVTKCDRGIDTDSRLDAVRSAAPGVVALAVSSHTGSGMDCFTDSLAGTVALIGPSGSGKSTLANVLIGEHALDTGTVREADSKGRHVTVRRELIPLATPGMTVIDTPGLRSVGLVSSEEGLQQTFSDIEALAQHCRFDDCAHTSEPGCAVQENVDPRRIANYQRLQRENYWATTRHDARANSRRLAEAKKLSKIQRRMYKNR